MSYYLVLVFAKTCGACINFKSQVWPRLSTMLPNGFATIIELPTTNSPMPTLTTDGKRIPGNLVNYINYFPTLMLVKISEWDSGRIVSPILFNIEGGQPVSRYPVTPEGVISWINANIGNSYAQNVVPRGTPLTATGTALLNRPGVNGLNGLNGVNGVNGVPFGTQQTILTPGTSLLNRQGGVNFPNSALLNRPGVNGVPLQTISNVGTPTYSDTVRAFYEVNLPNQVGQASRNALYTNNEFFQY